jgi:TonB family protein
MRPLSGFALALAFLISSFTGAGAQSAPSQAASPQTARQALIEMFFGDAPNHFEKHLPDVTRRAFQNLEGPNGQDALGTFSMLARQAHGEKEKFETFDTGSILFTSKNNPGGSYDKTEITVERDDLSGDEDQIELAMHMSRGGKEESLPFILNFTFSMKMESDIWRLNEISVALRMPLADPAFLKSLMQHQRDQQEQLATGSIRSIVSAEKSYQSAQGGFACTLSALGSTNKQSGPGRRYLYDSQLVSGKKSGYAFAISGCDSSHYQVVAEPAGPDSGQRAFCSDESGTMRSSSDGKGSTCLSSGEVVEEKISGVISELGAPQSNAAQHTTTFAASTPGQRTRVSQGISQGLLISKVQPIYPDTARTARISGTVVLKALINQAGEVESLSLISGHPLLVPAAIDAVKQWKYRPYLLNGKAVNVETEIQVNFTLIEN